MSGPSARPGSVRVQLPPNPSGSSRPWVSLKGQVWPANSGCSPALGREWGLIRHELEGLIPEADGNKPPKGAGTDPDHPVLWERSNNGLGLRGEA